MSGEVTSLGGEWSREGEMAGVGEREGMGENSVSAALRFGLGGKGGGASSFCLNIN
jgi:hypothetical protein